MRQIQDRLGALALASLLAACGSNNNSTGTSTSTAAGGHGGSGTGGGGAGGSAPTCTDGGSGTGIAHVVIVDPGEPHLRRLLRQLVHRAHGIERRPAPAARRCCEAAPAMDPAGASPVVLDDTENAAYDPTHAQSCEVGEIDGGKMDQFVTGQPCSDRDNFASRPRRVVQPYRDLAAQYAIADRYFQPIAGQSSSNDMYLAVAKEVFIDNAFEPNATGAQCSFTTTTMTYTGQTTIADLLETAGKTVAWYGEGYAAMVAAGKRLPHAPPTCGFQLPIYPCVYDPGDVPFLYYAQFATTPRSCATTPSSRRTSPQGTLPDVSYVKGLGYHSEHPGARHDDHRRRRPSSPASSRRSRRAATRTPRSCS